MDVNESFLQPSSKNRNVTKGMSHDTNDFLPPFSRFAFTCPDIEQEVMEAFLEKPCPSSCPDGIQRVKSISIPECFSPSSLSFLKMFHFIPLPEITSARQEAEALINQVFRLLSIPRDIVQNEVLSWKLSLLPSFVVSWVSLPSFYLPIFRPIDRQNVSVFSWPKNLVWLQLAHNSLTINSHRVNRHNQKELAW